MRPSPTRRCVPVAAPAATLSDLLTVLLRASPGRATVFGVLHRAGPAADASAPDAAHLELCVASLGNDHPERLLLGFDAPPHWWALGVTAPGRAHRAGGTTTCQVGAIAWSGGVVSRLTDAEGNGGDSYEPVGGFVADLLLRGLGLPTPAAAHDDIAELLTALWFDRLLRAAVAEPRRLSWVDLVAHHPLAAMIDQPITSLAPGELGDLVAATARALGCEGLRRFAAEGGMVVDQVPAELASWFDDGSFTRWLAQELPAPAGLLAELTDALAPRVAASLRTAMRRGSPRPPTTGRGGRPRPAAGHGGERGSGLRCPPW